MEVYNKIINILEDNKINYEFIEHDAAITCELSAHARGEPVGIGGKSILFKDKKDFRIFTLSAAKEIDSNKVRKILGSQRLRFARNEELSELCGVTKGALPPIVKGIYPFDHYLDKSILNNTKIAFNAGVLDKSIIMLVEDYLKLIDAKVCEFSK
jgi:Ala-tRNA(Pro) deacylase